MCYLSKEEIKKCFFPQSFLLNTILISAVHTISATH